MYDVVILGSGLAGSTLAARLGALGHSVALVDKRQFPRDKACAGGLSRVGADHLKELGIRSFPAQPFYSFVIAKNGAEQEIGSSTDNEPIGFGIERKTIDDLAVKSASSFSSVTPKLGKRILRV